MRERPELWERAPVSLNARGCAPALGARSRIYNPVPPAPALVARPARAGAAAAGHRGCFLLLLLENPTSSPPPPHLHLRVLSRFQRRPRPTPIAKETGEDPAAQPGQVSRPTWLTCGASCYRLARPSPAHPPSGSGYLRKLTRLEVEAVGNWEPPAP